MYTVYFSTDNKLWHPALTFEFVQREGAIAAAKALKNVVPDREFAVSPTHGTGWIYKSNSIQEIPK